MYKCIAICSLYEPFFGIAFSRGLIHVSKVIYFKYIMYITWKLRVKVSEIKFNDLLID